MTDDQYPTYQQPEPVVEVEVIPTPAVVEPVEVVEEPVVVPEPEVVVASTANFKACFVRIGSPIGNKAV